jgi:hypothetical protein
VGNAQEGPWGGDIAAGGRGSGGSHRWRRTRCRSSGPLARPAKRVLELAPASWQKTLEHQDAQQRLAANVYRQVALGEIDDHSARK